MPRKKKLPENQMDVTMTKGTGPTAQVVTKTVTAATPDDAVRRASQGETGQKPNQISVNTTSQNPQVPSTNPQATPPVPGQPMKPNQMESRKLKETIGAIDLGALQYPYRISLPEEYRGVLIRVCEAAGLPGTVDRTLVLRHASAMKEFLEGLSRVKDKRSLVIAEGIKRSVR